MEGLSLLLVVPVIVWSVAFAFGFTGCSYSPTRVPAAPTNLTVVAVSTTTVTLSWVNPNLAPVTFEIERTREGDSVPQQVPISSFPTEAVEVVDTNLEPDTNYLYQVLAVSVETDVSSSASNSVFAKTLP
jgi:hypothetical protein